MPSRAPVAATYSSTGTSFGLRLQAPRRGPALLYFKCTCSAVPESDDDEVEGVVEGHWPTRHRGDLPPFFCPSLRQHLIQAAAAAAAGAAATAARYALYVLITGTHGRDRGDSQHGGAGQQLNTPIRARKPPKPSFATPSFQKTEHV